MSKAVRKCDHCSRDLTPSQVRFCCRGCCRQAEYARERARKADQSVLTEQDRDYLRALAESTPFRLPRAGKES